MTDAAASPPNSPGSTDRGAPLWRIRGVRLLMVAAGLAAWFGTQSLIGARPDPGGKIGDAVLEWTARVNQFLLENPPWADGLLIASSALVDFLGVFLLGSAIFGKTLRPFIALLILFVLRQICQGLTALPPPEGMIWSHPGFPSLLVTYGVSNDLFFSGHTGISVVGAVELARAGGRPAKLLGLAIAAFEIAVVLVLRAHYTMDVYAGIVTALLAVAAADRISPVIDRGLAALAHGIRGR